MRAVTSRDLTTIICCLKWFTAETLTVRAWAAKTFRALGIGFFSNISGDSKRECACAVGLVLLALLTLLTALPRERTSPRLLAMANDPKENLEKRSENSLFLMLYVLLYIC